MKLLILASLLLSSAGFAKECVDLSGDYRIKLKEDCTRRSVKHMDRSSFDLQLTDDETLASVYVSPESVLEVKIVQEGCGKLMISVPYKDNFDRDPAGNPKDKIKVFTYLLSKKNIKRNGFKFVERDFSFEYFVPLYEKQKMFLKQRYAGSNEVLSITSFDFTAAILYLVIPTAGKDQVVNCDMHRVSE